MADPFTLGAVGGVVLSEAIKFLYGQAGELIKLRREKRVKKTTTDAQVFATPTELQEPDPELAAHFEPDLRELRHALADYADGVDPVETSDRALIDAVGALRNILEIVYHRDLTLRGESRQTANADVTGEARVREVAGYVAAVRAGRLVSGSVRGRLEAERVEAGGEAIGVDVDSVE
ncbi:hypothetical protein GCM10020358_55870 [Amorphoplanes nipponensis]|uniref:Uncharacterized protein n=1 Tax=Actinoplanes nipponensis TaxID=135950 RepID=A0A919MJK7_9ACTN|nr:hypothetical protein [Actinoplanes nipponensis]GIE51919.1 hypothetical protein Ani05nite_54530 [Actinoplanes nipponensis]